MKDNITKKELASQYKEREVVGGVCVIRNNKNNKILLETATDLQGSRNRFEFAKKTGSCVNLKLQRDWDEHGAPSFTFEVLEEIKKTDAQNSKEFKADVEALKEMWLEKLTDEVFY